MIFFSWSPGPPVIASVANRPGRHSKRPVRTREPANREPADRRTACVTATTANPVGFAVGDVEHARGVDEHAVRPRERALQRLGLRAVAALAGAEHGRMIPVVRSIARIT